jgi:PIN domain nuclease of toxin-antitoxin system
MGRGGAPVTVLADTHVLLWWLAGGGRLSRAADRAIEAADRVLVSPISCWEVGTLERQGRIRLDRPVSSWIAALLDDARTAVAPLSAEAAGWAGSIADDRFPGDPADRLVYATARELRVPLVTKDERLHVFAALDGAVRVVW